MYGGSAFMSGNPGWPCGGGGGPPGPMGNGRTKPAGGMPGSMSGLGPGAPPAGCITPGFG